MDQAVIDLYVILLRCKGRVKKIEVHGNMYTITTLRKVTYQNAVTKKESISDYQEVHVLRP